MSAQISPVHRSIRRHVIAAAAGFALLTIGIGGLSASVEFSGAVVAPGSVVVDRHVKKVQHPTGGVVGAINVRDGDRVKAGAVVLRLDETVARASLAIVEKGLDELAARQMRLVAERDGAAEMAVSLRMAARRSMPEVEDLLGGELKLFAARREARLGQVRQLRERIDQTREQIHGLEQQAVSKADETDLIRKELVGVESLYRSQLVPLTRVTNLRREETRLRGERGQLISETAQARGRLSEIEQQIIQIDQDLRSEVSKELREIQAKQAELVERKTAADDVLARIDLLAPQDGVVHQLAVFNPGGVIGAAETVMLIVPDGEDLMVEAKIAPQDIDQVRVGQKAFIRMSGLNQRTTPELAGEVTMVAADVVVDQRSGASHFPVRIALAPGERARLGERVLVPGMPAEAFVQTDYRTMLSYFTKPLADQVAKAFRQD
ncbi:HlyD family type I secretion periplasmic adaptor subunit [Methylopila sp. 73B]|uniref:HlyD family type I secretion periplasmic adaptor subunit n=1 Tax=Methylopila sp. 73B TaxID=1120792 RepID=UPI000368423B|nr:HlyD family type I secretion periplasmic adaptor subunit [Methylopila sp. 73B]